MSLTVHVQELRKKHQHLSDTVEALERSPSTDDLEIRAIKKKKLQLKEEIERLQPH